MRVSNARPSGPRAVGPARRAGEGARAAGAAAEFDLEATSARASVGGASGAAPAVAVAPVGGVAGLMALQGVTPREAAIERGGALLDALDEVKLALLGGGDPGAALGKLARESGRARPAFDEGAGPEPGLTGLLTAIDLRAAVELAKRER